MQLIELIKEWMYTGVIPSISSIIMAIVLLGLELAKNKLTKKLVDTQDVNEKLTSKVSNLESQVEDANEVAKNTNVILSVVIDMLHIAYANSKLNAEAKLQLQKLYDSCPDSMPTSLAPKLAAIIESEATQEQIQSVATTESYIDTIAKKIST